MNNKLKSKDVFALSLGFPSYEDMAEDFYVDPTASSFFVLVDVTIDQQEPKKMVLGTVIMMLEYYQVVHAIERRTAFDRSIELNSPARYAGGDVEMIDECVPAIVSKAAALDAEIREAKDAADEPYAGAFYRAVASQLPGILLNQQGGLPAYRDMVASTCDLLTGMVSPLNKPHFNQ